MNEIKTWKLNTNLKYASRGGVTFETRKNGDIYAIGRGSHGFQVVDIFYKNLTQ